MRSLPEKDFWDILRTRLRNYEEKPTNDDDWERIAAALKPTPWYKRKSVAVLALLLLVSGTAVWVMLPSGNDNNTLAENNPGNKTEVPPATGVVSPRTEGDQSETGEEQGDPSQQSDNASLPGENNSSATAEQRRLQAGSSNDASTSSSGAGITQVTVHDKPGSISKQSPDAQVKVQAGQRAEKDKETLPASRSATSPNDRRSASGKTARKPQTAQSTEQSGADTRETSVNKSATNVPASSAYGEAGDGVAMSEQSTVASDNNGVVTTGRTQKAKSVTSGEDISKPSTEAQRASAATNSEGISKTSTEAKRTGAVTSGDNISKVFTQTNVTGTKSTNVATVGDTHADTVKHNDTIANGTSAVVPSTRDAIVGTTESSGHASHRFAPDTIGANGSGIVTDQIAVSPVVNKDSTIVKAGDKKKAPSKTAKEEEQKRKAWHPMLYFSLTPSLAFQKVTPMRNDDIHISGLQEQSLVSGNRAGISLETGGQVTLLKGFDLYGGLAYYQQSQSITYNYTLPSSTNVSSQESMDYVITPQGGARKFRYAMRNAGVSAGFLYTVKDARLMHKIGAGLQYQRGFMKARSGDTYENSGSQYLNYQVHYRLEWAATRAGRTRLFVQPAFIHSFWSHETLREPLTLKPYRVGLSFGVNVAF